MGSESEGKKTLSRWLPNPYVFIIVGIIIILGSTSIASGVIATDCLEAAGKKDTANYKYAEGMVIGGSVGIVIAVGLLATSMYMKTGFLSNVSRGAKNLSDKADRLNYVTSSEFKTITDQKRDALLKKQYDDNEAATAASIVNQRNADLLAQYQQKEATAATDTTATAATAATAPGSYYY
jgi:hypothetical protein